MDNKNIQSERRVRRDRRQVVYTPVVEETPKQPLAWRVIIARAGLILASVALLWVIFFSGWLNVRNVRLQGKHSFAAETIASDVKSYFERFPTQRNVLFLQTKELSDYIRSLHPTLEKVNISRTVLLDINVLLQETEPALIWQSGSKDWLIGEDGRVLRVVTEGDASFGRVIDIAQIQVGSGDKVADSNFVSFVREVYEIGRNNNLEIDKVFISDTTREINVQLTSGVIIKMAVQRGAGEQMVAYQKTIQTAEREGTPIKEYVDVRITGKTYYK